MDIFERLAGKIKSKFKNITSRLKAYFKKLLFPIYLFPIKFITYTLYYLIKFLIKLILAIIGLIIDCIKYPFKSLKNFLKSIVYVVIIIYLFFSLVVIADYLRKQYGSFAKIFCGPATTDKLKKSVVRIEGSYMEGSGFFISENQVLTNFHVIAGEPSPKIILAEGTIVTPTKIIGDKNTDLALLFIDGKYPDFVYSLPEELGFYDNEPLISAGYALGTDMVGNATVVKGNFIDYRTSRKDPIGYVQTNMSLVPGMSGGPLVDQCGSLVGVNTMGVAGLSLFIGAQNISTLIPNFTDNDIAKIQVDPSKSPEDAVYAFYTYLKARRMEDGFNLLSTEYLQKTNFEEWTGRFTDILDVDIIKSERFENTKDTAFVKFSTKNWVDGEVEDHYYEGTWKTVLEDGVYKMLKSKIVEVDNPGWDWFYE